PRGEVSRCAEDHDPAGGGDFFEQAEFFFGDEPRDGGGRRGHQRALAPVAAVAGCVRPAPAAAPPDVFPAAWTASPPTSLRRAAQRRNAEGSFWGDTKRWSRAVGSTGTETPESMACWTVQRPSPESST